MDKKQKTLLFILTGIVILSVSAFTYAFFTAPMGNTREQEVEVSVGSLSMTFNDKENSLIFGKVLGGGY